MIQSIEVWNWEGYEHAIVDDLSPGLNLFWGLSNAGKSSLTRALRLVAYNEFDQESVREGSDNARVKIITQRGTVDVTRGKKNLWEITPVGGEAEPYSKIGTKPLPRAMEILGLGLVHLGDMDIPVNIMDQAEGHFMLAELDGKSASGSMRAQIVDEISGLSGIEGLIKEVSLDNHRLQREVKELQDRAAETRKAMHDAGLLDCEERVLAKAAEQMAHRDDCAALIADCTKTMQEHARVSQELAGVVDRLNRIPDIERAAESLKLAEEAMKVIPAMSALYWDGQREDDAREKTEDALAVIPDLDALGTVLTTAVDAMDALRTTRVMQSDYQRACVLANRSEEALAALPDPDMARTLLDSAGVVVDRLRDAKALLRTYATASGQANVVSRQLDECTETLGRAQLEQTRILSSIQICPVNLRPISPDCLKGIRVPVSSEAMEGAAK